jgi:hypothetical protein
MNHVSRSTLALAAILAVPSAFATAAPQSSLQGAWTAQVTLLDCPSGQPAGAPPFRAVVVFHAGGTLSEASGPSVQRTPSFGTWRREGGRDFSARSVLLTYDANGLWTGMQEIRRTITLAADGLSFVAETITIATDSQGTVRFQGCARGAAQRFE